MNYQTDWIRGLLRQKDARVEEDAREALYMVEHTGEEEMYTGSHGLCHSGSPVFVLDNKCLNL
jgi:hypothetical protein